MKRIWFRVRFGSPVFARCLRSWAIWFATGQAEGVFMFGELVTATSRDGPNKPWTHAQTGKLRVVK